MSLAAFWSLSYIYNRVWHFHEKFLKIPCSAFICAARCSWRASSFWSKLIAGFFLACFFNEFGLFNRLEVTLMIQLGILIRCFVFFKILLSKVVKPVVPLFIKEVYIAVTVWRRILGKLKRYFVQIKWINRTITFSYGYNAKLRHWGASAFLFMPWKKSMMLSKSGKLIVALILIQHGSKWYSNCERMLWKKCHWFLDAITEFKR